jgi:hypothetical protein
MQEKFEDTKWVIRSCKSKKHRKCNGVNVLSFTAHAPLLRQGMFEHGVSETE